jgi:hypothetical protein
MHEVLLLSLFLDFQQTRIELMKKWNEENVVNNKEHDTVLKAAGISRETVWV